MSPTNHISSLANHPSPIDRTSMLPPALDTAGFTPRKPNRAHTTAPHSSIDELRARLRASAGSTPLRAPKATTGPSRTSTGQLFTSAQRSGALNPRVVAEAGTLPRTGQKEPVEPIKPTLTGAAIPFARSLAPPGAPSAIIAREPSSALATGLPSPSRESKLGARGAPSTRIPRLMPGHARPDAPATLHPSPLSLQLPTHDIGDSSESRSQASVPLEEEVLSPAPAHALAKEELVPESKSVTHAETAPAPKAPTPKAPTPKAPTPKAPTPKAPTAKPTSRQSTPRKLRRSERDSDSSSAWGDSDESFVAEAKALGWDRPIGPSASDEVEEVWLDPPVLTPRRKVATRPSSVRGDDATTPPPRQSVSRAPGTPTDETGTPATPVTPGRVKVHRRRRSSTVSPRRSLLPAMPRPLSPNDDPLLLKPSTSMRDVSSLLSAKSAAGFTGQFTPATEPNTDLDATSFCSAFVTHGASASALSLAPPDTSDLSFGTSGWDREGAYASFDSNDGAGHNDDLPILEDVPGANGAISCSSFASMTGHSSLSAATANTSTDSSLSSADTYVARTANHSYDQGAVSPSVSTIKEFTVAPQPDVSVAFSPDSESGSESSTIAVSALEAEEVEAVGMPDFVRLLRGVTATPPAEPDQTWASAAQPSQSFSVLQLSLSSLESVTAQLTLSAHSDGDDSNGDDSGQDEWDDALPERPAPRGSEAGEAAATATEESESFVSAAPELDTDASSCTVISTSSASFSSAVGPASPAPAPTPPPTSARAGTSGKQKDEHGVVPMSTWSRSEWSKLDLALIAEVEANEAFRLAGRPPERASAVRSISTRLVVDRFLAACGLDRHVLPPDARDGTEASKAGQGSGPSPWTPRSLKARATSLRIALADAVELGAVQPGSVKHDLKAYRRLAKSQGPKQVEGRCADERTHGRVGQWEALGPSLEPKKVTAHPVTVDVKDAAPMTEFAFIPSVGPTKDSIGAGTPTPVVARTHSQRPPRRPTFINPLTPEPRR